MPPARKTSLRKVQVKKMDPARLASVAMERIKTLLARTGRIDRFTAAATMKELVGRGNVLGRGLPTSYQAALRVATGIGEPEVLLDQVGMREALVAGAKTKLDVARYVPFCKDEGGIVCFDLHSPSSDRDGELGVIRWEGGAIRGRFRHFGEWIDAVADRREEDADRAARIPPGLKRLLVQLGFSFDDPLVGRLETGDADAIRALVGDDTEAIVRADKGRFFDSSGKASLVLNLDEFTVAVSLRTGIYVYEAEDVFRWLRSFRDENFFSETPNAPSHPDAVRDLRKAPREVVLAQRGVLDAVALPAEGHVFRAASGVGPEDFWLLGRTRSTRDDAPSLLVHVADGHVAESHEVEETLTDLHVTPDGTIWGLSPVGTAVRFAGGKARPFALSRRSRGRPWWYGIGGDTGRVLSWGAGALLEFDGVEFSPFLPEPELEQNEAVVSARLDGSVLTMLVCAPQLGAVARFDGRKWLSIGEAQVIHEALIAMDLWRDVAVILTKDGDIWRMEVGHGPSGWAAARPRRVTWDERRDAFVTDVGARRPLHAVRGFDGGALLASDGGVIAVGAKEPVFHAAPDPTAPARLARVGKGDASLLVAMCGGAAWRWEKNELVPIDLRNVE
jgi:hypothetical protein